MAETTSTEPTEEVIETQINDLDPRFIKQLESAEKSIDKILAIPSISAQLSLRNIPLA